MIYNENYFFSLVNNPINGQGLLVSYIQSLMLKINFYPENFIFIKRVFINKPKLNLAVSILKKSNRFEFLLEKAVEIGVSEITHIISKHTEKKKLNFERFRSKITILLAIWPIFIVKFPFLYLTSLK